MQTRDVDGVATDEELRRVDAEAVEDDDLDAFGVEAAEIAAERTRRRVRRVASQVYSVRVPVDRLEDLRQLAAARGEAPTALMRQWVLERLDEETLGTGPSRHPWVFHDRSAESLLATAETLRSAAEALTHAAAALAGSRSVRT